MPLLVGIFDDDSLNVMPGSLSVLTFPQRTALASRCSWLEPVRFQTSSSATCTVRVTRRSCPVNRRLSARLFDLRPPPPSGRRGRDATKQIIARPSAAGPPRGDVSFACSTSASAGEEHASKCAWDDGQAPPPEPSYAGRLCRNVVVSVVHNVTWSGQRIVSVDTRITVADIRVVDDEMDNVDINQAFRISFTAARPRGRKRGASNSQTPAGVVTNSNSDPVGNSAEVHRPYAPLSSEGKMQRRCELFDCSC